MRYGVMIFLFFVLLCPLAAEEVMKKDLEPFTFLLEAKPADVPDELNGGVEGSPAADQEQFIEGVKVMISGNAIGTPTFPENAMFQVEIRRYIYSVQWGTREITYGLSNETQKSITVRLSPKQRFYLETSIDGPGMYQVIAMYNPDTQQYANVKKSMGEANKQYRFQVDLNLTEMGILPERENQENAPEGMSEGEREALINMITETRTMVKNFETAAVSDNGDKLIKGRDRMVEEIENSILSIADINKHLTYTSVPPLLLDLLRNFKPYIIKTSSRVQAGQSPFVLTKEELEEIKNDPAYIKEHKNDPPADPSHEEMDSDKILYTSYGTRLSCANLQKDLDMMVEVLDREEILLTLGNLRRSYDDLMRFYETKDKYLSDVRSMLTEGTNSLMKAHQKIMSGDEGVAKIRKTALRGHQDEYMRILKNLQSLVQLTANTSEKAQKRNQDKIDGLTKEIRMGIDTIRESVLGGHYADLEDDQGDDDDKKDKKDAPKRK